MQQSTEALDIRRIIETFAMERHPTAGWYSPHYSDSELWGRPKLSSIYYLLAGDEPLPLHRTGAIEIWHYYMGAPAEFVVSNGGRMKVTSAVGIDLAAGQQPQLAVPAHLWQSARSLGEWTLLGCTASPGFTAREAFVMDADR